MAQVDVLEELKKLSTTERLKVAEEALHLVRLADALTYWDISLEANGRAFGPQVETAIYTGTAMLNTLINRG
jgi:hypothetical protein